MDYYSILGVDRSASQDEIKKAYRKLAMKNHPDRGGDTETLAKINEAYNILKDPQKRQQYDTPQPQFNFRSSHVNINGGNFDSIFEQMFGFQGFRQQQRNRDIQLSYDIALEECFTGKTVSIKYRLPSGDERALEIDIPKGVKHGDVVRIKDQGDISIKELPPGHLMLRINVKRHHTWTLDGIDLYLVKEFSIFDLMTGTRIQLDMPDGSSVKLNIPAGTQSETVMSIPEHGLIDMKTSKRGKVFVKIKVKIPKVTDKKLIQKLEKLKNEIS